PRRELDALERRVALRRLGVLGADGPALRRIDNREIGVKSFGDVALGIQAEASSRVVARERRHAVVRQPTLAAFRDERRQQVLGAAEAGFREPDVAEGFLRHLGLVPAARMVAHHPMHVASEQLLPEILDIFARPDWWIYLSERPRLGVDV